MFNPEVSKLRVGIQLWKLIIDYRNFWNIFMSFRNVKYDFFFPLEQSDAFLEASSIIHFNSMEFATLSHLGSYRFSTRKSHEPLSLRVFYG